MWMAVLGWYALVLMVISFLVVIGDDNKKGAEKVAGMVFVYAPIIAYLALKLLS